MKARQRTSATPRHNHSHARYVASVNDPVIPAATQAQGLLLRQPADFLRLQRRYGNAFVQ